VLTTGQAVADAGKTVSCARYTVIVTIWLGLPALSYARTPITFGPGARAIPVIEKEAEFPDKSWLPVLLFAALTTITSSRPDPPASVAVPLTVMGELVNVCPLVGLEIRTVGGVVSGAG